MADWRPAQFTPAVVNGIVDYYVNHITNRLERLPLTCFVSYFDNNHRTVDDAQHITTLTDLFPVLNTIAHHLHIHDEYENVIHRTGNFVNMDDPAYVTLRTVLTEMFSTFCVEIAGDPNYMDYLATLV